MVKGNIPIGFSDSLLWKEFLEFGTTISGRIETENNQIKLFTEEEKEIMKKITLEDRLQCIRDNRIKNSIKVKRLKEISEMFNKPLVKNIGKIEEKIANSMEKRITKKGGISWSKLTLVFNAFGFSKEIIAKLEENLDGKNFFDCNIFDKCENLNIALDLAYIKLMMSRYKSLPTQTHFDKCTVCACDTPKKLEDILKQHHFELNFEILSTNGINGRRFISTPDWIQKLVPEQEHNQYRTAVLEMQQLHSPS